MPFVCPQPTQVLQEELLCLRSQKQMTSQRTSRFTLSNPLSYIWGSPRKAGDISLSCSQLLTPNPPGLTIRIKDFKTGF